MPFKQEQMPRLELAEGGSIAAKGHWRVEALAMPGVIASIRRNLKALSGSGSASWDLSQVLTMDYIGAELLWEEWERKRPERLILPHSHENLFGRLEQAGRLELPEIRKEDTILSFSWLEKWSSGMADHSLGMIRLIGQLVLDFGQLLGNPQLGPWKEISSNVYRAGAQALGITALVAFLIGVVLSFLSSQQLHVFGGDIYIVNILGMSIVRELGPMLAAILVAGRSGSSMTAQLGVMRVTEELDAMLVMGLPHGFRLILPKVLALAVAMPLLVVWTDAIALLGGIAAAHLELGLSVTYFIQKLPDAVPLANFWIGLGKGAVFGVLIALVACHFGLRIEPNTESLGRGTTFSVVTAITAVILADAIFAIVFKGVGFR